MLVLYESIGVEICGLVCDGGGSNESFIKKIVEKFDLDKEHTDIDSVSMIHPLDNNRRIFIWSCGTHSLKAIRNNLFRSKQNGTRNLKMNDCHFGWKDVEAIYMRDENRALAGDFRRTDIVKQTICLDSFTMMNAAYAKHIFTSKTISEVLSHISTQVNVTLDTSKVYKSEWHKFSDHASTLEETIITKPTMNVTSQFALLKYQVAVYGIFIERFWNKYWKLTKDNIDEQEHVMKSIVKFLYDWRIEILLSNAQNALATNVGEKYFMSMKTYYKIR